VTILDEAIVLATDVVTSGVTSAVTSGVTSEVTIEVTDAVLGAMELSSIAGPCFFLRKPNM
jgi:hypothetical protein